MGKSRSREIGRLFGLASLALMLALSVALMQKDVAQAKATTVTTNISVPVPFDVYVPCAISGLGEVVDLSGEVHMLFHSTDDDNGGTHVVMHGNPQGVTGVGLMSGDKYQGTGMTRVSFSTQGPFPSQYSFVSNFRFIGPGPGNNLTMHTVNHVTVNANGDVTATVSNVRVDCQ